MGVVAAVVWLAPDGARKSWENVLAKGCSFCHVVELGMNASPHKSLINRILRQIGNRHGIADVALLED
jgi:hypothetical protein